jgi:hypothetical protein
MKFLWQFEIHRRFSIWSLFKPFLCIVYIKCIVPGICSIILYIHNVKTLFILTLKCMIKWFFISWIHKRKNKTLFSHFLFHFWKHVCPIIHISIIFFHKKINYSNIFGNINFSIRYIFYIYMIWLSCQFMQDYLLLK